MLRLCHRFHLVLVIQPARLYLAEVIAMVTQLLLGLVLLLDGVVFLPLGLQVNALVIFAILKRNLVLFES